MDKELKEAIKKAMDNPKEFYAAMREIRLEKIKEHQPQRIRYGKERSKND